MTIRVIREGTLPKPLPNEWEGECSRCGCQMAADQFPETCPPSPPAMDSKPYDSKRYFSVRCATCGDRLSMSRKNSE